MASRFSAGDYVAQVLAYETDALRLLRDTQLHVHGGKVLYAALFLCRFSGQSSAIEKRAIAAASPRQIDRNQSTGSTAHIDDTHRDRLQGELFLTLLHVDTTWRFDSFESRLASPKLSWPAIRALFTPGTFVEADLILKDQYYHPDACRIPPPAAHLLHVDIHCSTRSDAAVHEIALKLRTDILFWTRQLLFECDPAHSGMPLNGSKYVLMLEVDTRHTAETLASNLNAESMRNLSGPNIEQALIRIFSLTGSATYHDMTPVDPAELPIDNRTHNQAVLEDSGQVEPESETYFGLRPESYVHI